VKTRKNTIRVRAYARATNQSMAKAPTSTAVNPAKASRNRRAAHTGSA